MRAARGQGRGKVVATTISLSKVPFSLVQGLFPFPNESYPQSYCLFLKRYGGRRSRDRNGAMGAPRSSVIEQASEKS